MIPKATEDTITSILKDELVRLQVKVLLFPSISTPVGPRKPDMVCQNAGDYPVEAKFTDRDLIKAIAKVQNDYLKHHKVLGIKGGFAILHPEQLSQPMPVETIKEMALQLKFKLIAMFPPEDTRPFRVYEASLNEIAKTLAEHILTPPKYVEPSIDFIIKSLREAAMYILNGLKHLTSKELESFFGGKDVFKNILQYEEGKYPVEELKFAAAYLLVNQLLFYHTLSKLRAEFPEVDPDAIHQPPDLNQYFNKVLDINYRTVFSYDVASLIPPKFLQEIRTLVSVISGLGAQKVGGDLLGTIFHDLIPFEVRKKLGAFYTNILAAELLAALSIDRADAKVADFASGSGGLLVAAYRRKRDLLGHPLTQEIHEHFVEDELLGVDVMPFAANVAACHLALQSPQHFTNRVSMAIWDSTDLRPGRTIPSVADLKMVLTGQSFLDPYTTPKKEAKGTVALSGRAAEKITLGTYDVIMMNPPFTRQERIPDEYKQILLSRFDDYKEYLHGQLGYHGYFILLADRFLKEGGRLALVLPATVLRVKSFEGIRKLLSEKYHVEYIITTLYRSAFSESVRFREILLVARKSKPTNKEKTIVTVLKKLPGTPMEAKAIADRIRGSKERWEDEVATIKVYDYSRLLSNVGNWFKYIALSDVHLIDIFEELSKSDKLVPLSSIGNLVRGFELRGGVVSKLIINRSEERAIKSGDVWLLSEHKGSLIKFRHRAADVEFQVPEKTVRRTLRRPSGMNKMDATGELDYVIVGRWEEGEFGRFQDAIGIKIKDAILKSIRNDVDRRLGNLFVVRRMNLSAPRTCVLALHSSREAAPTKLMWSLKVPDEQGKVLATYLNSSINLLQTLLLRVETEGAFIELSEYVLDEFLIPDPAKLNKSECRRLIEVFDKIKRVEFPCILDQLRNKHSSRRLIDTTWLKILGYKSDVNAFLDRLYDSLANEIELLKRIMAEGETLEDSEESE